MSLLCRLGLHRTNWTRHRTTTWIQTRTCTRCNQPIARRHH